MPNENQNTGSFGAGLGGVDALKAAMQRRGLSASILDQVSASAPTGASAVAPSVPQDANNVMTQTATQAAQPAKEEAPFNSGEMEIATKSLKSIIDTDNAVKKAAIKLQSPQGVL